MIFFARTPISGWAGAAINAFGIATLNSRIAVLRIVRLSLSVCSTTVIHCHGVIPAQAGIHGHRMSKTEFRHFDHFLRRQCSWIPACAGMTENVVVHAKTFTTPPQ
jgi:hypothetical protein